MAPAVSDRESNPRSLDRKSDVLPIAPSRHATYRTVFVGLFLTCLQWPLFMAIEHERVHIETSSVLIRQLPVAMVTTPPGWNYAPTESGLILIIIIARLPAILPVIQVYYNGDIVGLLMNNKNK